jgi:Bacterial mobilisation protein (MobC)
MRPFCAPKEKKMSRRSGSQMRRASAQIKVNCTPEQKAAITAKARALRQSSSAICLHVLLNEPWPPALHSRLDEQNLARFLFAAGQYKNALKALQGEIGKLGNNLNQLTRYAHLDRLMGDSVRVAQQDLSGIVQRVQECLEDCTEMRAMALPVFPEKQQRPPSPAAQH